MKYIHTVILIKETRLMVKREIKYNTVNILLYWPSYFSKLV